MEKVTFDQKGVDSIRDQLAALSPDDFQKQLVLMQNTTRDWLSDNFILTDDQLNFLNDMPDEDVAVIGTCTAIGFDYNLPITLQPADSTDCLNLHFHIHGGGIYTPGGSGTFERCTVTAIFNL